jgi:acetyl esterase/lipase
MASEHLVDAELKPILAFFPPLNLTREGLAEIRATVAKMIAEAPKLEELPVSVKPLTIPGPRGAPPIRVMCYRPNQSERPLPAVLHIHGGGYVIGAPEMADLANRRLASEVGCAIFSVDYRLAPETPHPGPLEDCYAALAWLHDNAASLRVDPTRIAVKGESAGGGLAAALALLARDRGTVRLAHQHLIYPMIDDRTSAGDSATTHPFVGDYIWTPVHNHFGWTSLLDAPPGGPGTSPYAAAARAEDLAGLPPSFISVGALDLFLEEDMDYARRLMRAGVPVEFHVYPGAFHAFDIAPQTARTAIAAARDSREALRRALYD